MRATAAFEQGIIPYVQHLRGLPFVQRVTIPKPGPRDAADLPELHFKTPGGTQAVQIKWSKSHLSRQLLEHILASARTLREPLLVLAPRIGGETARRFEQSGINYVDLAGNCHLHLGKHYVAHIEGRSPPEQAPGERSLRPASLRILFTLLASPTALEQTVRRVASSSGNVSPQTVAEVRKRLATEGCIEVVRRKHRWIPGGKERALDLLLANYEMLAHKLVVRRYHSTLKKVEDVEAEIVRVLGRSRQDWWWGGGAALERKTGYYRGNKTIVYTDRTWGLGPHLRMPTSAEDGNVVIMKLPGAVAAPSEFRTDRERIVHPLLIYLDLMSEGEERSRDAAAELRRTLFEGLSP